MEHKAYMNELFVERNQEKYIAARVNRTRKIRERA